MVVFLAVAQAVAVRYVNVIHSETTEIHIVVETGFIMKLSLVQYGGFLVPECVPSTHITATALVPLPQIKPCHIALPQYTFLSHKECALSCECVPLAYIRLSKTKSLVPLPQTPLCHTSLIQYAFLSHENAYHWHT